MRVLNPKHCLFRSLCVDNTGAVYIADSGNHCIRKLSPDGQVKYPEPRTLNPEPCIRQLNLDGQVLVVVCGELNCELMTIQVSTVAGSGQAGSRDGTLTDASFGYPYGICIDKSMGFAKSGGARSVSLLCNGPKP